MTIRSLRINLIVLQLVFLVTGLLACTAQETIPSVGPDEGINLELVREVEAITDQQVQKIAFVEMLTIEEKTFFFKKRIVGKIQTLPLTTEQRDHLTVLLANMSPEVYTNSARSRKSESFLTAWTETGKEIFDEAVLSDIVASISPLGSEKDKTKLAAPPKTKCGCATSSDWCSDGYGCTYIPSCNTEGCGTLFACTCNGRCDRIL
ncbi:MAG TPA: bacteriocin fulvocin C-related protein [Fibrella sp.]